MISMKDMMNTTLLSKRWCNLWHLRRNLQFDVHNVFGSKEQVLKEGYLVIEEKGHEKLKRNASDECRDEFVRRVDQFVKNFKGTEIDSFMVKFCLNHQQSKNIDEWIRFAIARGVGRINLLFCSKIKYFDHVDDSCYKFPFGLSFDQCDKYSTTLKYMRLRFCHLVYHPTSFDIFPFTNLRSLELKMSNVDVNSLATLLSNCFLLEELSLIWCRLNSSTLKIGSSSLSHLKIDYCYENENENEDENSWRRRRGGRFLVLVSLHCPKLTSLYYNQTRCSDIISMNAPILKIIYYFDHLDAGLNEIFAFLATFPKLEVLNLYICPDLYYYFPEEGIDILLQNLRELNLSVHAAVDNFHIRWIFPILQASPSLQKLSLMTAYPLSILQNKKDIEDLVMFFDDEMFFHDEIKVIELGGCVGNWYEIEFAMNALKYIHSLERLVLSSDWIDEYFRNHNIMWSGDQTWSQNGREIILETLQAKGIELDKLVLK